MREICKLTDDYCHQKVYSAKIYRYAVHMEMKCIGREKERFIVCAINSNIILSIYLYSNLMMLYYLRVCGLLQSLSMHSIQRYCRLIMRPWERLMLEE